MLKDTISYLKDNKKLLFVIVPAIILTLLPFIFDGETDCVKGACGFIIGTNYRDGIWFQAVAATSFKTFPFQMPNFAGEALRGYHYLPNLLAYLLSIIGIPIAVTYYKLIPIFYFTLLTILIVQLGKKIINKPMFVGMLLFFTYFGMHLSLITSLYHFGEIRNQVLINTFQATRILESPHTAIALLIMFGILSMLYRKKLSIKRRILIGVMVFLSFGIKFYVAFSIMTILFIFELLQFIQSKKIKPFILHNTIYGVGALIAIILFYDPFGRTGSVFIFSPFSTVHHLIESPDLFYSEQLVLARYFLYEHGWSPRLLMIELYSALLFMVFYFGMRVIGFTQVGYQLLKRKINNIEVAVIISVLVSIAVSVLFIQKGDWFNPIQFAVPAAFLMNIFTAKLLFNIINKNKYIGYTLLLIVVLITFPANLSNLTYLNNPGRFVIPQEEMDALNFLKKQPEGTIFAPLDENDMAYVSAFTGKPTYINFASVLENSGIRHQDRLDRINDTLDFSKMDIKYLYLPIDNEQSKKIKSTFPQAHLIKIYSNNTVTIYTNNDSFR